MKKQKISYFSFHGNIHVTSVNNLIFNCEKEIREGAEHLYISISSLDGSAYLQTKITIYGREYLKQLESQSKGKSVILMLLLTVIFSWIVTLILAFMPKVETESN